MVHMRSLTLVAIATILAAALAPSAAVAVPPAREHKPEPWFVLVSHRIDLKRDAERMVATGRDASVQLLSGPQFVINLTSGVVVDGDGHVLTRLVNLNPASREHDLKVTTATGKVLDAAFVGLDQPTGLAVLEVAGLRGATPAPETPATPLAAGASVRVVTARYQIPQVTIPVERIAIYPKLRVSAGRVLAAPTAALARGGVVATVAAGEVSSSADIGFVERADGGFVGIALYASPGRANLFPVAFARDVVARRVVDANGSVRAGWLGAFGMTLADVPVASRPQWARDDGVLIQTIAAGGPAAAAGLRRDDLVVGFDGLEVRTARDLVQAVGTTPAGTRIELDVLRDGRPIKLTSVLGAQSIDPSRPPVPAATDAQTLKAEITALRNELAKTRDPATRDALRREVRAREAKLSAAGVAVGLDAEALGVAVHSLTAQEAAVYGTAGGVQVTDVAAASAAAAAGLRAVDVIVRAAGLPVADAVGLDAAIRRAQNAGSSEILLDVRRDRQTLAVRVRIPAPAAPK
jgi:serine protease Do